MITSGSNTEAPAGALFFENNGSVRLHVASTVTEEEREAIILASDFFQYALEREDWLKEFTDHILDRGLEQSEDEVLFDRANKSVKLTKNDLFLIYGGKTDEEIN